MNFMIVYQPEFFVEVRAILGGIPQAIPYRELDGFSDEKCCLSEASPNGRAQRNSQYKPYCH